MLNTGGGACETLLRAHTHTGEQCVGRRAKRTRRRHPCRCRVGACLRRLYHAGCKHSQVRCPNERETRDYNQRRALLLHEQRGKWPHSGLGPHGTRSRSATLQLALHRARALCSLISLFCSTQKQQQSYSATNYLALLFSAASSRLARLTCCVLAPAAASAPNPHSYLP